MLDNLFRYMMMMKKKPLRSKEIFMNAYPLNQMKHICAHNMYIFCNKNVVVYKNDPKKAQNYDICVSQ